MNVNWISIGFDDWTAKIGKHILRAEKMDRGLWWWAVVDIHSGILATDYSKTRKAAMNKCVESYSDLNHD